MDEMHQAIMRSRAVPTPLVTIGRLLIPAVLKKPVAPMFISLCG
jgi:hypothetical protein